MGDVARAAEQRHGEIRAEATDSTLRRQTARLPRRRRAHRRALPFPVNSSTELRPLEAGADMAESPDRLPFWVDA
jgi:hypothetical protein